MSRNPARLPAVRGRRSFTMVELLVTITILGILAGLMLGALAVVRTSAREAATRARIAKIHNILMAKYESYRTRRVPLNDTDLIHIAGVNPVPPPTAAAIRLRALYDIIRMEMPDRWSDITTPPQYAIRWDTNLSQLVANPPSIYRAYQSRYAAHAPSSNFAPAKCLYMLLTMSGGEDVRRQFHSDEISTDTDGYSMFVDGWGHPIYFLRWAPGFIDSELQWNCMTREQFAAGQDWNDPATNVQKQQAAIDDHDPLDPRRLTTGWRLYPLVYSPGPDGEYGINIDSSGVTAYVWQNDHYTQGFGLPSRDTNGVPLNTDLDNIHNHYINMEAK